MASEKRLIDAYKLEDLLRSNCSRYHHKDDVIAAIAGQPTVDAVEVVHGQWLVDDYDSGDPEYYSAFIEVHCSKCGYSLGAENGQYGWYYGDPFPMNYCPNCGAKMDGDGNG